MLIDTFTTLGRIFGAAADGDVHLDAPYDELAKKLGDLAAEYYRYNGWFAPEFVKQCSHLRIICLVRIISFSPACSLHLLQP